MPIKVVTPDEFFEIESIEQPGPKPWRRSPLHEELIATLESAFKRMPTAVAIVKFTVMALDSSQLGRSQYLFVGPDQTYKDVAACEGQHLGDVPSRFQYPEKAVLLTPEIFEGLKNVHFERG